MDNKKGRQLCDNNLVQSSKATSATACTNESLSKVATIGVNECATLGMGDEVLERIIEKDNKFRKLHLAWIKKFRTLIIF